MARKPVPAPAELIDDADATSGHFARVVAVIVGLENYRKPKSGDAPPRLPTRTPTLKPLATHCMRSSRTCRKAMSTSR
jgi:hypothetical protein